MRSSKLAIPLACRVGRTSRSSPEGRQSARRSWRALLSPGGSGDETAPPAGLARQRSVRREAPRSVVVEAALARVWRALRRGGWALLAVVDEDGDGDDLASAVTRLCCTLWGGLRWLTRR